MQFHVEINGEKVLARRGETILGLLNRNGIRVPTLCHMNGFLPSGSCRICVVEVDGIAELVPACSHQVEEWMKIRTHSARVIRARRTIIELILAGHPEDCFYCGKSGKCELQGLADELNLSERKYRGSRKIAPVDRNCPAIERDPAKCILCGRCIRVCEETIGVAAIGFIGRGNKSVLGTTLNKGLNDKACVKCGQCIMVCPTGALREKSSWQKIVEALNNSEVYPVIQVSPTVPISIAEEVGLKSGKDMMGLLLPALAKMGFRQVYDTVSGADLMVAEVVAEFKERLKNKGTFPLFTGSCPSWAKYVTDMRPDLAPHLSEVSSPQIITATLIKQYFMAKAGIRPEKVFTVSVMPCTSAKYEAKLPGNDRMADAVITTRELLRLIRYFGIDLSQMEPEPAYSSQNLRSSAGLLHGVSGGTLEAIIRTLHAEINDQEMPNVKISDLRGLKGRKEIKIKMGRTILGFVAVNGLANAKILLDEIRAGRNDIHLVEIMACPNGCINGGGQPFDISEKAMRSRMKLLYDADETEFIRVAHKNPLVREIYDRLLGQPGSAKSREMIYSKMIKPEEA
jgi:iron-only hydrogenase group A